MVPLFMRPLFLSASSIICFFVVFFHLHPLCNEKKKILHLLHLYEVEPMRLLLVCLSWSKHTATKYVVIALGGKNDTATTLAVWWLDDWKWFVVKKKKKKKTCLSHRVPSEHQVCEERHVQYPIHCDPFTETGGTFFISSLSSLPYVIARKLVFPDTTPSEGVAFAGLSKRWTSALRLKWKMG